MINGLACCLYARTLRCSVHARMRALTSVRFCACVRCGARGTDAIHEPCANVPRLEPLGALAQCVRAPECMPTHQHASTENQLGRPAPLLVVVVAPAQASAMLCVSSMCERGTQQVRQGRWPHACGHYTRLLPRTPQPPFEGGCMCCRLRAVVAAVVA